MSNVKQIKVTYRGWPGHYILGSRCVFHLNTLVECGDTKIVVSTVGNLRNNPAKTVAAEPLGSDIAPHYYETFSGHAALREGYWEVNVCATVSLSCKTTVPVCNLQSDKKAQQMHEDAVEEVVDKIMKGEIK